MLKTTLAISPASKSSSLADRVQLSGALTDSIKTSGTSAIARLQEDTLTISKEARTIALSDDDKAALQQLGKSEETKTADSEEDDLDKMIKKLQEKIAKLQSEIAQLASKSDDASIEKVKAMEQEMTVLYAQLIELLTQKLESEQQASN